MHPAKINIAVSRAQYARLLLCHPQAFAKTAVSGLIVPLASGTCRGPFLQRRGQLAHTSWRSSPSFLPKEIICAYDSGSGDKEFTSGHSDDLAELVSGGGIFL